MACFPWLGDWPRPGADTFAIGSVAEGAALRQGEPEATILSLVGPVLPEDDELVLANDLVPFIHDFRPARPVGRPVRQDRPVLRHSPSNATRAWRGSGSWSRTSSA